MSSKLIFESAVRYSLQSSRSCPRCLSLALTLQRRTATTGNTPKRSDNPNNPTKAPVQNVPANPVLEKYLQSKSDAKTATPPQITRGSMSKNSIFDVVEQPLPEEEEGLKTEVDPDERTRRRGTVLRTGPFERNVELMNTVIDPDPKNRQRWERKMVIRQVKKRGRLTKTQVLKRTEREYKTRTLKPIKTSIKKLGMLARQVAGKPIDEAILQMQYSKKRAALEVKDHLVRAKERAIILRGMGLGQAQGTAGEPIDIELKDGSRKRVNDRTSIYIDEAWVNRSRFEKSIEYRARGGTNILRHPSTHLSVVLKEEKTRIRLSDERLKKMENRKLWLPLQDRPVTLQRQYPLW